ncbi:hypothetical protein A3849_29865 [Paenibacillus sp. P46E]|nr:hypothetical protein A3849_29865 [Paenibacillus sp. P46E]
MWKSGSGRLDLRIFTAKGNEKNLESTAIGTTVRSRSVITKFPCASYFKTKGRPKKPFMAFGTPLFFCMMRDVSEMHHKGKYQITQTL